MRLNKNIFFPSLVLLCLVLILLIFGINRIGEPKITCNKFIDRSSDAHCGLFLSNKEKSSAVVIGKIIGKEKGKDTFSFKFKTANSLGAFSTYSFSLPSDPFPLSLISLTRKNEYKIGARVDPIKSVNANKLYDSLKIDDEIMINVSSPEKNVIQKIRQDFKDQKILSCFDTNKKFIDYMVNSNLLSKIGFELERITSGCNIYTFEIQNY